MNRREFIAGLLSLIIAETVIAKTDKHKKINVYVDESGNIGLSEAFVVGALIVDATYDYKHLEDIRNESGFNQVLKYSSSNRYKLNLSAPLINEFFASNKMRYGAIIFPKVVNNSWPSRKKLRTELYKKNYKTLLKENIYNSVDVNLYLERRSQSGEDAFLKTFLETQLDSLKVNFLKDKDSDLLQLSDLFTGSIYGELSGVRDKTKTNVIEHLISSMGVSKMPRNLNYNEGKFKVEVKSRI